MSPLVRYTLAVLLTLLCWRQTFLDGLAGRVDFATAVTRFLIILIVARIAMRLIGNLVDRYRTLNLTESAHPQVVGADRRTSNGSGRANGPSSGPISGLRRDDLQSGDQQ